MSSTKRAARRRRTHLRAGHQDADVETPRVGASPSGPSRQPTRTAVRGTRCATCRQRRASGPKSPHTGSRPSNLTSMTSKANKLIGTRAAAPTPASRTSSRTVRTPSTAWTPHQPRHCPINLNRRRRHEPRSSSRPRGAGRGGRRRWAGGVHPRRRCHLQLENLKQRASLIVIP